MVTDQASQAPGDPERRPSTQLRPGTAGGRRALAMVRADPDGVLLALDFDGTLAPVVDRPEEAAVDPAAPPALATLAARGARVAIVTGRPVADVQQLGPALFHLPGLVVLGHYGLERWSGGEVTAPEPHPHLDAARAAVAELVSGSPAGVTMEDKGRSVAVHTRRAAAPGAALAELRVAVAAIAESTGLEVVPGRYVLELRPPGIDKGGALRDLIGELGPSAVLFFGDDRGDLPAVAVVRSLAVPALVVCADSPESPDELRAGADLIVDGPSGVVDLLLSLT